MFGGKFNFLSGGRVGSDVLLSEWISLFNIPSN